MEEEQQDNKLDVLDIIAVKAKQGIGIAVDLAAIAGIEQRIDNADASGDGNVDLAELQKLMGEVDLSSAFPGKVRTNQNHFYMVYVICYCVCYCAKAVCVLTRFLSSVCSRNHGNF